MITGHKGGLRGAHCGDFGDGEEKSLPFDLFGLSVFCPGLRIN